jgi:hypothetical protein
LFRVFQHDDLTDVGRAVATSAHVHEQAIARFQGRPHALIAHDNPTAEQATQ